MAEWETAPSQSSEWETAQKPALLNPNIAAQGAKAETSQDFLRTLSEFGSRRDPGIDYKTGVKDFKFRAAFSRMDNDAEKEQFLNRSVGQNAWGKDSSGAYFLKPEGLRALGIQSENPVSLDEQLTTRYDIADVLGDLPAIAGGAGLGLAATGLGAPTGMLMAGLGAAGGKSIDEIVKNLMGQQVKTPGEVATTLGKEAALGAGGEGLARVIGGVTKFGLGPGAHRMTPAKKELADAAVSQGFQVRPGSVTDAPILARWEGMVRQIFGDLHAEKNIKAASEGVERLATAAGPRTTIEAAGSSVVSAIRKQRVSFSEVMGQRYSEVDKLVGGMPIVPTAPLKEQAQAILGSMAKTEKGKVVGGKDSLLRDILKMGNNMTVQEAQRLRTVLREASQSPDILPDVRMHDALTLKNSVQDALERAKGRDDISRDAITRLRAADEAYAQGIRQFDKPVIKRITQDASKGTVDADMVVEYIIKPERTVRLRQVKALVPEAEWAKVRSAHAQHLLSNVVKGTDDPLVQVFDGKAFRDTLNSYGREALEEVHGKGWVDDAYKYANSLMLAEKKMKLSGGIVAANVALHPIRNLPKLVWIRALASVMEQPGTFKYLTEGFKFEPGTKQFANALNKLATQTMMHARDETGSASFTITDPEDLK